MNRQQRRRKERELKKMQKQADEATDTRRGVNITVCVPSQSNVSAFFAYDLAQMMSFTASHYVQPGVIGGLGLGIQVGTYVHVARQMLAQAALTNDSDYLLFIDSDMRFPPDALIQLLVHQLPMVGINYVARMYPPRYLAVKTAADIDDPDSKGLILETLPESEGLEQVDAVGFGLVLIRRDVFEALPKPREHGPWWWYQWMPAHGAQIGEDMYFCRAVRKAGIQIMVDHDLSKQVKHVGLEQYTLEHAWAHKKLLPKEEDPDGDSDESQHAEDGDRGHPEPDGPKLCD